MPAVLYFTISVTNFMLFFIDFYSLSFSPKGERFLTGGVEKVHFNHKAHKEVTKDTKIKPCNSDLCDLCVEPL
jgi:hypothetical protein